MNERRYREKARTWYGDRFYRNRVRTHRPRQIQLGKILFAHLRPRRVVDLGCGIGSYLEAALACGAEEVLGLEYSYQIVAPYVPQSVASYVRPGDGGRPIDRDLHGRFDCAISFEVAEHLPPEASPIFVKNLTSLSTAIVVLTAAPPGQLGIGHINLRPKAFWVDLLRDTGWSIDDTTTQDISRRWRKAPGRPRFRYLARNLMIFRPS